MTREKKRATHDPGGRIFPATPGLVSSTPFHPRLFFKYVGRQHDVSIAFDPRLEFTDTGQHLMGVALGNLLFKPITPNDLRRFAGETVNNLNDIYAQGELIANENLHLSTMPLWKHDCAECTFLGQAHDVDFYYCEQTIVRSLISRFGSNGAQYVSGAPLAMHDERIWMAAVLAESMNMGQFLSEHHTIVID